jgi:hypothetical protein
VMFRSLLLIVLIMAPGIAAADPPDRTVDDDAFNYIAALVDESAALSLPARIERALSLTLRAAGDALREGQTDRAVVLLRTFTFEVRGVKRAKRLPAEAADVLIAGAEDAIGALRKSQ